jgi:hypothetical protein
MSDRFADALVFIEGGALAHLLSSVALLAGGLANRLFVVLLVLVYLLLLSSSVSVRSYVL